jgi:hypothetical protein
MAGNVQPGHPKPKCCQATKGRGANSGSDAAIEVLTAALVCRRPPYQWFAKHPAGAAMPRQRSLGLICKAIANASYPKPLAPNLLVAELAFLPTQGSFF